MTVTEISPAGRLSEGTTRITLSVGTLGRFLSATRPIAATGRRNNWPHAGAVTITSHGHGVELTVYDGDNVVVTAVPDDAVAEGPDRQATVSGTGLRDLVAAARRGSGSPARANRANLTLDIPTESDTPLVATVHRTGGPNLVVSLPITAAEPPAFVVTDRPPVAIPGLLAALPAVLHAAGTDDMLPVFQRVQVTAAADGPTLYTTDRYRAARDTLAPCGLDSDIAIPLHLAATLTALAPAAEVELTASSTDDMGLQCFTLTAGNTRVHWRDDGLVFPRIAHLFDCNPPIQATVDTATLRDAVLAASPGTKNRRGRAWVDLEVTEGTIAILGQTLAAPITVPAHNVATNPDAAVVRFNAGYLTDLLKSFTCTALDLELQDGRPCLFKPAEGERESHTGLVMAMRLTD